MSARRRAAAIVLAALLAIEAAVPIARATTLDPDVGDGPRKVLLYAGCAVGVAAASSTPGLILAFIACGKMLLEELSN